MEETSRNVAIVASVVYGAFLVCGWIFFCFSFRGEPLYNIRSPHIATFYVFSFAFLPSLFFLGATAPWMCAAYISEAATITLAVVPGGLFVLLGLSWVFLGDLVFNEVPKDPMRYFAFRPDPRGPPVGGVYPGMDLDAQGGYVGSRPWTREEMDRLVAEVRRQAHESPMYPTQPPPLPVLYGGARESIANDDTNANMRCGVDGNTQSFGVPRHVMAASLADPSGTTAPVGFDGYLADPDIVNTPPLQQHHLVPSPFPTNRSGGGSTYSPRRPPANGSQVGSAAHQSLWLDDDGSADSVVPEPLFPARSPRDEEVYLDVPFRGRARA